MIPEEEQQRQIQDFHLQDALWNAPQEPVTDKHCHLDLLADCWRVSCEEAIQQVID